MKTHGDSTAMPMIVDCGQQGTEINRGLNKREVFAMASMHALIVSGMAGHGHYDDEASAAVDYADALIEALNK